MTAPCFGDPAHCRCDAHRAARAERARPPERIRLQRTKGWRKPEGAIVVARPSRWGNPFIIAHALEAGMASDEAGARRLCVEAFTSCILRGEQSDWWFEKGRDRFEWMTEHLHELRGHDLACWCGVGLPCHGDVLLKLANEATP